MKIQNKKEKNKTIWFFCSSEPNQLDNNLVKHRRHGQLINYLKKKYNIVLWTSNFSHFTKKTRTIKNETKLIKFDKNLKIFALKTLPYKKNVSFKRYLSNFLLAQELKKNIRSLEKPDLVVTSIPPVEPSVEFIKFAKKNNIPCICDFRDMWPDIILYNFNFFMRIIFYPFFIFMNQQIKFLRNNSTHIVSVSDGMLKWIFKKSKKNISAKYIYISHQIEKPKIRKYKKKIKIFYAGVIGTANSMENFLYNFNKLNIEIKNKFEINIAGYGDTYEIIKKKINIKNVRFLGWLNNNQIKKYALESNYGLVTYKNRIDFLNNVPNKISEYLGYGLPVITTLKGESYKLMKEKNCVYFCDITNFVEFKKTFNLIVLNKNYKQEQKNARELFDKKFNSSINLKKFEKIVDDII